MQQSPTKFKKKWEFLIKFPSIPLWILIVKLKIKRQEQLSTHQGYSDMPKQKKSLKSKKNILNE